MITLRRGRKKKLNRVDNRVHIFVPFVCAKCGSLKIDVTQNTETKRQKLVKNILDKEFVFGIPGEDINPNSNVKCSECGSKKVFKIFSYVRINKEDVERENLSSYLERFLNKYEVYEPKEAVISIPNKVEDNPFKLFISNKNCNETTKKKRGRPKKVETDLKEVNKQDILKKSKVTRRKGRVKKAEYPQDKPKRIGCSRKKEAVNVEKIIKKTAKSLF